MVAVVPLWQECAVGTPHVSYPGGTGQRGEAGSRKQGWYLKIFRSAPSDPFPTEVLCLKGSTTFPHSATIWTKCLYICPFKGHDAVKPQHTRSYLHILGTFYPSLKLGRCLFMNKNRYLTFPWLKTIWGGKGLFCYISISLLIVEWSLDRNSYRTGAWEQEL